MSISSIRYHNESSYIYIICLFLILIFFSPFRYMVSAINFFFCFHFVQTTTIYIFCLLYEQWWWLTLWLAKINYIYNKKWIFSIFFFRSVKTATRIYFLLLKFFSLVLIIITIIILLLFVKTKFFHHSNEFSHASMK